MEPHVHFHSISKGWTQAHLGPLLANLPEILMRDVVAKGRRTIAIEDPRNPCRYVQVLADADGDLYVEVVSNAFLDGNERLSAEQEEAITTLGFLPPEGIESNHPNWWWYPTEGRFELEACRRLAAAMTDVFGVRKSEVVWVLQRAL